MKGLLYVIILMNTFFIKASEVKNKNTLFPEFMDWYVKQVYDHVSMNIEMNNLCFKYFGVKEMDRNTTEIIKNQTYKTNSGVCYAINIMDELNYEGCSVSTVLTTISYKDWTESVFESKNIPLNLLFLLRNLSQYKFKRENIKLLIAEDKNKLFEDLKKYKELKSERSLDNATFIIDTPSEIEVTVIDKIFTSISSKFYSRPFPEEQIPYHIFYITNEDWEIDEPISIHQLNEIESDTNIYVYYVMKFDKELFESISWEELQKGTEDYKVKPKLKNNLIKRIGNRWSYEQTVLGLGVRIYQYFQKSESNCRNICIFNSISCISLNLNIYYQLRVSKNENTIVYSFFIENIYKKTTLCIEFHIHPVKYSIARITSNSKRIPVFESLPIWVQIQHIKSYIGNYLIEDPRQVYLLNSLIDDSTHQVDWNEQKLKVRVDKERDYLTKLFKKISLFLMESNLKDATIYIDFFNSFLITKVQININFIENHIILKKMTLTNVYILEEIQDCITEELLSNIIEKYYRKIKGSQKAFLLILKICDRNDKATYYIIKVLQGDEEVTIINTIKSETEQNQLKKYLEGI